MFLSPQSHRTKVSEHKKHLRLHFRKFKEDKMMLAKLNKLLQLTFQEENYTQKAHFTVSMNHSILFDSFLRDLCNKFKIM